MDQYDILVGLLSQLDWFEGRGKKINEIIKEWSCCVMRDKRKGEKKEKEISPFANIPR